MLYDNTVLVVFIYFRVQTFYTHYKFILLDAEIKSKIKTMKSELIVPFEDQSYFLHSQHLDENLFQILGKGFLSHVFSRQHAETS